MIVAPRHFVRFMDGRAGKYLTIGFLPGHIGGYLQTLQTSVTLAREYALKLMRKKIKLENFEEVQSCIDHGWCMLIDQYRISFLYEKDQLKPEIYFLILKTDKARSEVWLVTMHRIKAKQFQQKLASGKILRRHSEDFME